MPRYAGDPRWIEARYAGACRRCGRDVKPGERVFYYPRERAIYCAADGCGGAESARFESAAFDEDVLGGGR